MSSPEELYLDNLGAIQRMAAFVARRNHLSVQEAEDFIQDVKLRLLEDDYAIIRKFEGHSKFTTYLNTVITRLFYQYRVEMWGKWRPSAKAKELGDKAITLELLITRDGYTFDEAVKVLTTPGGSQYTTAELEAIYIRLPHRGPRPIEVSGEISPDVASVDAEADDRVEQADREKWARKAATVIDGLIESMPAEDRLIVQLRFWGGLKVPDIARRLQVEQKKLYKRLERLFGVMRIDLERAGVGKAEVGILLSKGDQEINLKILRDTKEIGSFRPSQKRGGNGARGEGGLR